MSTNYNAMKKEDLINELQKTNEILQSTNEVLQSKDEELKSVKSDIDSLKEMILAMQKQQKEVKEEVRPTKVSYEDEMVQIGSCLVGRHILCDGMRNEIVDLADFGDVASIGVRLLDSIMTPQNKELFRKGLVYFLDDKWYDRYSIRKTTVLNNETLDKLYKLPTQEMFKEINKMTDNGVNKKVEYTIYWAIVKNIASNRPGYQDRNKEIELNAFFKVDISNSINLLKCVKEMNYE